MNFATWTGSELQTPQHCCSTSESQSHFHPHSSSSRVCRGQSQAANVQLSPQPRTCGHLTPSFCSVYCLCINYFSDLLRAYTATESRDVRRSPSQITAWFFRPQESQRCRRPFHFRMRKPPTWKVKCKLDFQLWASYFANIQPDQFQSVFITLSYLILATTSWAGSKYYYPSLQVRKLAQNVNTVFAAKSILPYCFTQNPQAGKAYD